MEPSVISMASLWLCLVIPMTEGSQYRRYAQVATSTFPSELSDTLLANLSFSAAATYRFGCAQKCTDAEFYGLCNLACVVGPECHLFEQLVADGWRGFDDPAALDFESCLTSWVTNPRRTLPASVSAISTAAGSDAGRAARGFPGRDLSSCFSSEAGPSPWWVADLGVSKPVARVTVVGRQDGVVASWALELRLGDSSDAGTNAVFDSSENYPSAVTAQMSFASSVPRSGRYLSLHSLSDASDTVLALCDVQILAREPEPRMRNCLELFQAGHLRSGVYTIFPQSCCPVRVFCDMDTDGGGWTVFQRREDLLPREDFYRTWLEYAQGFGLSPSREHWLGLDHIHALTAHGPSELRVHLADFDGASVYAKYSTFNVADRANEYKLTVTGYSGNAGDALTAKHNGMDFSAKDRGKTNCATRYKGAWWYESCHHANLNGQYLKGAHASFADGVNWYEWKGHYYSLKTTIMMTRTKV